MPAVIEEKKITNTRYTTNYTLTLFILDAIHYIRPDLAQAEVQEKFREWVRDENGASAMGQLVSLIIH